MSMQLIRKYAEREVRSILFSQQYDPGGMQVDALLELVATIVEADHTRIVQVIQDVREEYPAEVFSGEVGQGIRMALDRIVTSVQEA